MIRLFIFIAIASIFCQPLSAQKGKKKKGKTQPKVMLSASDQEIIEKIFLEGVQAKLLDKIPEAKEKFLDCLNIDPTNAAANYELALIYEEENNLPEASLYAEKAAKSNPKNKWYAYLYADLLLAQNDYTSAIDVYQSIIDQNPENPDNYSRLFYIYKITGQNEKAIETLDVLESKVGIIESVTIDKQRLYLQLNEVDKAGQELEKLIEAYPSNPSYYNLLAEMYMANGKKDKAYNVYQRLIEVAPNHPSAKVALAQQLRAKGNNAEADKLLLEVFQLPEFSIDTKVEMLMNMTNSAAANGQPIPAIIEDLGIAITESHPKDARAFAVLGDVYMRTQKAEKALESYEKTVENDANLYAVWEQIFFLQSDLNKMDEMASSSKSAIELFPNQAIPYYFNGLANNRLSQHEKAVKSLKKASLIGADNRNLLGEVYSLLGDSYNSLKKHEKSDESFDKALEIDPNNAFVMNNYAYYLSLRKDGLEKAAEMSKKSNELLPDNASFQDTYAWILYEMGNYEEAKTWIEKSMKNGGNQRPVIVEHYGDILYKLGLPNQAVGQWQDALKLGGDAGTLQPKIDKRGL